jgi:DNA-binding response OmpR family regulator
VEGLEIFRRTRPDLVITDIVMPQKEGMETILDLRREQPSVPILAISGSTESAPTYLNFATMLGADAALIEPIRVDDLLREIDKLLVATHPYGERPQSPHPTEYDEGQKRSHADHRP